MKVENYSVKVEKRKGEQKFQLLYNVENEWVSPTLWIL